MRTVEGVLESAFGRFLGTAPKLSVAGRTDAGVHASGQVASFVGAPGIDPGRIQRALNGMLAPEVVIRSVRLVPPGFDARRSASGREYVYRIRTAALPDPFTARFVWNRPGPLKLAPMRRAAGLLKGDHDFASFCRAPRLPASTRRTLHKLSVSVAGEEVRLRAASDGFLHQMVRSLAGTLVAVGEGRIEAESMPRILAARTRAAAGPVAPPMGLALVRVSYGRRREMA
jgi:tRNA pseudouridine38-40 synthase